MRRANIEAFPASLSTDRLRDVDVAGPNDEVLAPLLAAADAASRQRALETILVQHVQPAVGSVLTRYRFPTIREEDADDLAATIVLRVLRRLQELTPDSDPIRRLRDYVATVSYNVVYTFLRRRYPARSRLRNRLRYRMSHDGRFAMWDDVCGLAEWRGRKAGAVPALEKPSRTMLDRDEPGDALQAIFEHAGGPLRLDDVVALAADLWQVVDATGGEPAEDQLSQAESPAAELETREYVAALWREIRELRPNQRAALLLNLRDVQGTNGVALLVLAEVATFDEVAAAMDMTPARLTQIWNDLPLDDLTIAAMLNISRQQVINMRRAARERLSRRTAAFRPYR